MNVRRNLVGLLALGAFGAPMAVASPVVPGEVVVRFEPGTTISQRSDALDAVAKSSALGGAGRATVVGLADGVTVAEGLAVLRQEADVLWAEPNYRWSAAAIPDDPGFIDQWGLRNVGQPIGAITGLAGADTNVADAWDLTTGEPTVDVAVVDSGLAVGHPDLSPNISTRVPGRDIIDNDAIAQDDAGHGTMVGIDDGQKFLIVFLGTVFQLALLVADDVRRVPMDHVEVGRTLGLRESAILGRIVVPSAMPAIWDSLRITLGWAWTWVTLAEIVNVTSGFGYRINRAQTALDNRLVFAYIVILGILGLVTDQGMRLLGRVLFRWSAARR